MWRELVKKSFKDAKFVTPAEQAEIDAAEAELGVSLPNELRLLLLETNGVTAHYSSPLVWPAHEIATQNRHYREYPAFVELYMPFDSLLFFGGEGNGDLFGYRILGGQIRETSWIYKWEHEDDERLWFASDLADYLRRSVPKDE